MRITALISLTRNYANEPGRVPDSLIGTYINHAVRDLFEEVVKTDQNYFERVLLLSLQDGQDLVPGVANRLAFRRIADVWIVGDQPQASFRLIYRRRAEFTSQPENAASPSRLGPTWYTLDGNDLRIYPKAQGSGWKIKIRYLLPWYPLIEGTISSISGNDVVVPISAISPAGSESWVEEGTFVGAPVRLIQNSAYHGKLFECTSSSISPSDYVLTLTPDIPAAVAPFGTLYTEPPFPPEFDELPALYAAHRLFTMERNLDMSSRFLADYENGKRRLIETISGRRRDGPDSITYIPDGYDYPLVPF